MARITPSELLFIVSISLLTLKTTAFHLNEQPRSEPPNPMKDYMSRGMLQCSTTYMQTIGELQKLIKKAYIEHMKCKEEMDKADKNYPKYNHELFDEMLVRWQEEDAVEGSSPPSEENTSLPPLPSTTETPLSRRKRTHRPTH